MVVKMMRWPPWPPLSTRKFEAKVLIHKLRGLNLGQSETENDDESKKRLVVEVKWKGQKGIALRPLRRSAKREFTEEGSFCGEGVCEWNEEFKSVCNLSGFKDGVFYPWEVAFSVFNGGNQGLGNKILVGTAALNLAEYASMAMEKELEINVPLIVPNGTAESSLSLCLSLKLMELRTIQVLPQAAQEGMEPVPQSPSSVGTPSRQKDEFSGFKAGLRKVRICQGTQKACHEEEGSDGICCVRSEDAEDSYPLDTDSLDDDAEEESEDSNRDSSVQQSFNYESLAYANIAGGSFFPNSIYAKEGWTYYDKLKPDVPPSSSGSETVYEHSLRQNVKRGLLPWGKRKLRFRSPRPKAKGEPLLKKDHREDGGDDIDFDRRQLSSSDESSFGWNKSEEGSTTSRSSISEFGDDNFAIGSWERKEVLSRDGQMKLQTQVFFASIDQRSERAAGESACTALVAVLANWLQSNPSEVPIKSEFDSLIRDGSLEWRNLCENEEYRQRFPDKHFDLETILQAGIRPLRVIPEKSFIGFFLPEGLEDRDFDFLRGAMSFDGIWQEIGRFEADCPDGDSLVYIVSWNDHFFLLKVDHDAYYIIDTLGERLYEGCNQAYVLKFDRDAKIQRLPKESKAASEEKSVRDKVKPSNSKAKKSAEKVVSETKNVGGKNEMEEETVCRGKESCKEYIKSFLAAIPIRELQGDIKKGLMASTPLHHRLQIEFHYTQLTQPAPSSS